MIAALLQRIGWARSWATYYRHTWGPLCWTCRDCRVLRRTGPWP